jgi:hypothetical protein
VRAQQQPNPSACALTRACRSPPVFIFTTLRVVQLWLGLRQRAALAAAVCGVPLLRKWANGAMVLAFQAADAAGDAAAAWHRITGAAALRCATLRCARLPCAA